MEAYRRSYGIHLVSGGSLIVSTGDRKSKRTIRDVCPRRVPTVFVSPGIATDRLDATRSVERYVYCIDTEIQRDFAEQAIAANSAVVHASCLRTSRARPPHGRLVAFANKTHAP